MPKKTKIAQADAHQLMFAPDPLEIVQKGRQKVPNYVVRGTVVQRGRPLSPYGQNWLAARAVSFMLERVFTSPEPHFKEARLMLKRAGVTKQPRLLHFELLKLIEAVYPNTISKNDLAGMLDVTREKLEQALTYLRDFGAVTVGVSILPTGEGRVGIATLDLWVTYQNNLTRQQVKLEQTKQLHGAVGVPVENEIHIRERFEMIQPTLFELEDSEVARASD